MIAEYRFRYDEAFVIESLKRYRKQHSFRSWRWLLKSIGFLGLVGMVGIGVLAKSAPLSGFFIFFILLLAVAPFFDYWLMRRRFRKSPFFNSDVTIRFSDQGYYGEDANSRTELTWAVFTRGRRFPDGFLLFTGPQHYHWFPDRALVNGDVGQVDAVLRANVTGYVGADQC